MRKNIFGVASICLLLGLTGCGSEEAGTNIVPGATDTSETYTVDTRISNVINDPVFGDCGRLIFPVDTECYSL